MDEKFKKEIFEDLRKIDLTGKIKQKIGLSYLSWADAWELIKERYPDSELIIKTRKVVTTETYSLVDEGITKTFSHSYENEVPYFTDGKTCWVDVSLRIKNETESEPFYAITNNKNLSVAYNNITSTDINKAIQRAFVKVCARFGLGLYIYQGEDLPSSEKVVINFKDISANCDRYKVVALDDQGFETLRQTVISQLTKYSAYDNKEILNYPTKILGGQRVSQITNSSTNAEILQKLNYYFGELDKIFAANNS